MAARHRTPESVSWKPVPKLYGSGAGGALTIIVVWILHSVGVDVPDVVAAAIATLLASAGVYLAPQWTEPPAPPPRALTDAEPKTGQAGPRLAADRSTALPPESDDATRE